MAGHAERRRNGERKGERVVGGKGVVTQQRGATWRNVLQNQDDKRGVCPRDVRRADTRYRANNRSNNRRRVGPRIRRICAHVPYTSSRPNGYRRYSRTGSTTVQFVTAIIGEELGEEREFRWKLDSFRRWRRIRVGNCILIRRRITHRRVGYQRGVISTTTTTSPMKRRRRWLSSWLRLMVAFSLRSPLHG